MKINDKQQLKKLLFKLDSSDDGSGIGIEIEHIVTHEKDGTNAGFDMICELLKRVQTRISSQFLFDKDTLIGLQCGKNTITLEPGAQFELSIAPKESLFELEKDYYTMMHTIEEEAKALGLRFLDTGISPKLSHKEIKIVPKKRYISMSNYLPGRLHAVMMRETASIQVSLDYKDEADAIRKLRLANLISPCATAIFANSNFRLGKPTSYKSFRALAWLFTDDARCGFPDKRLFDKGYDYTFDDYLQKILDVPMIFIERGGENIDLKGKITFDEFLKNGYEGFFAEEKDFETHASLVFFEVRLKKYLELRNQDMQPNEKKFSVPAFYKGIFEDEQSMLEVEDLLKEITFAELEKARLDAPRYGLEAKFGSFTLKEASKKLLKISYNSLKKQAQGEEKHLEQFIKPTSTNVSTKKSHEKIHQIF